MTLEFLGVWMQPQASYAKWKADGVTTMVGLETENNRYTKVQLRAAVKSAGLNYMDSPSDLNDLEMLIADPACIRLLHAKTATNPVDEPDLYLPAHNVDPAGFAKATGEMIAQWKPYYDKCAKRKKFWINFAGPKVTAARPAYQGQGQKWATPYCDSVSMDWYPIVVNTLRYWDQYNASAGEIIPVTGVKCLKGDFPGKDVSAYLEICDQNLDKSETPGDPKNIGRPPTYNEVMKEAVDLVDAGVVGLIYFAHRIGGGLPWDPAGAAGKTAWDGRNSDQVKACRDISARFISNVPVTSQPSDLERRVASIEDTLKLHDTALTFNNAKIMELGQAAVIDDQRLKQLEAKRVVTDIQVTKG